jgi:CBS domain-containing protein
MSTEFDLPVARFMTAPVRTLRDSTALADAARILDELGVSALPVVDHNGHLIGVLERADLLRAGRLRHTAARGEARFWWPEASVEECMQSSVPVMSPDQPLQQCARRMLERGLRRVYVVGDHELEGVVSTREMMAAVARSECETRISELGLGVAATSSANAPLSVARARFLANPAREPLVVHDLDGAPLGVFTHAELQACLEADGDQTTELFIDRRILVLPVTVSVQRAASEALVSGAHYVIATEGPAVYRVLSGSTFTRSVYGGPITNPESSFAAAAPAPPVSIRDPDFRGGVLASFLDSLAPWTGFDSARPPPSELPGAESTASAKPGAERPGSEKPSAEKPGSERPGSEKPNAEPRREATTLRRAPA